MLMAGSACSNDRLRAFEDPVHVVRRARGGTRDVGSVANQAAGAQIGAVGKNRGHAVHGGPCAQRLAGVMVAVSETIDIPCAAQALGLGKCCIDAEREGAVSTVVG